MSQIENAGNGASKATVWPKWYMGVLFLLPVISVCCFFVISCVLRIYRIMAHAFFDGWHFITFYDVLDSVGEMLAGSPSFWTPNSVWDMLAGSSVIYWVPGWLTVFAFVLFVGELAMIIWAVRSDAGMGQKRLERGVMVFAINAYLVVCAMVDMFVTDTLVEVAGFPASPAFFLLFLTIAVEVGIAGWAWVTGALRSIVFD